MIVSKTEVDIRCSPLMERTCRYDLFLSILLALAVAYFCGGCKVKGRGSAVKPAPAGQFDPIHSVPEFRDITDAAGLNFTQSCGGCGLRYFPEQFAAGAAVLDANGDGNLDIYFPQPRPLGECVGKVQGDFAHRLYLGDGKGHFKLKPDAFHGVQTDFGIAAAIGDYDNDGRPDIYVCCYGKNKLFHNNGDGTFSDVTKKAGVEAGGLSTGAVWFDYDGDGKLDLYVLRYCEWSVKTDIACYDNTGRRDYCEPQKYKPTTNLLFHNNGDGTFTNVTVKSGAVPGRRRGLAAAAVDFDSDGRLDLFVANDLGANYLLHNNRNGSFTDMAAEKGVAFGLNGKKQANMGIATGDFNDTGRFSFLVTTFAQEPRTLYRNDGKFFTDVSEESGIAAATRSYLAFGTGFLDTRNSGLLDLFCSNGHVLPSASKRDPPEMFAMPNQLFLNNGNQKFVESPHSLPAKDIRVHRGACFGDFDNDGRIDVLVTAFDGRPTLLHNETKTGNWLILKLINKYGCSTAIGTRCIATVGGKKLLRAVIGGGSYGGDSDYRVHFGLGTASKAARIDIQWMSGKLQVLKDVPANQILTVTESK